jgi:hypothetical protein
MNRIHKKRSLRLVQRQKTRLTFRQIAVASSAFFILLVSGFVVYFNFSNPKQAYAAVAGDFRTIASGNWNTVAIWERYNGAAWAAAAAAPVSTDATISIQNGHTVNVTAPVTVDQVVVDAGGTLTISTAAMTVANGAGTDVTVNGTLNISNTMTISLLSNIDVNGLATLKAGGTIAFGATGVINVNGRFRRAGGTMPITAPNWSINNGGTFEHAVNGASLLPSASWKAGSTCEVTGITNTMPGNINMIFHHFIWNCPGQLAGFDFNARFDWVNGNLTIISTGASTLQFDYQGNNNTTNIGGNLTIQGGTSYGCANGSAVFNIGGNYVQTGGEFAYNQSWANSYGNTSTTLNIAGNLVMTGGIMDMTQSTANNANIGKGHINLMGNINLSGTALLTERSADSHGEIVFAGTAIQTYDLNNLVTNKIDYIINPGATVRTGLNLLTSDGFFTIMPAGHIMIGSPEGIAKTSMTGNVRVTDTRTYDIGADYTYEGASAQISGDGLPYQVRNLTLNNASNCTLTNSSSVSSTLTFQSGLWIATTDTLTLGISTGTRGTLNRITGHVVGYFRRWLTTVTVNNILFPVGTLNYYNGANFSFTTAPTSGGSIVSTFIAQNPGKLGLPQLDGAILCDGIGYAYWQFGPYNGFSGGAYTVNLYANGFAGITDYTSLRICRRNGAGIPWSFNGTHAPGTGSNAAPVANRTGKTILGQYGITSGGPNPLPVKLLSFNATAGNNAIDLTWATAAELNNNYFTLERSPNGHEFFEVTRVKGSGTTSSRHNYLFTDEQPLAGTSYYRLKQTDYNGKTETFKIVTVSLAEKNNSLNRLHVSPNPFREFFTAQFESSEEEELEMQIINLNGSILFSEKIISEKGSNIYRYTPSSKIKYGTYIFRILNSKTVLKTTKVVYN